jgi:hypothetical protein
LPLIALGATVVFVLANPNMLRYAAALTAAGGTSAPLRVHAGVPFVIRDRYATQICVSSHDGEPLPPFVLPTDGQSPGVVLRLGGQVQALVPFVVRDRNGTQVCVSSRGGRVYLPLVVP